MIKHYSLSYYIDESGKAKEVYYSGNITSIEAMQMIQQVIIHEAVNKAQQEAKIKEIPDENEPKINPKGIAGNPSDNNPKA